MAIPQYTKEEGTVPMILRTFSERSSILLYVLLGSVMSIA